jgi:hypothetical protein
VTKHDILSFLEKAPAAPAASRTSPTGPTAPAASIFTSGEATHVEKMGIMRKKIADHMLTSLKTSAHVYSAYEVDFSRIDQLRLLRKADYERAGTKLTYTAFIARATVEAIREFDPETQRSGASLKQVRLLPGTVFHDAQEWNRGYMARLPPERLLYTFRVNAGLPVGSATPLGGWEQPENGKRSSELRGHFVGHFLSASALLYASTGATDVKAHADAMVAACREDLDLGLAVHRVVVGLADDRARNAEVLADADDLGDAPAAKIGHAEIARLARADHVAQRVHRFFERRVGEVDGTTFHEG